MISNSHESFMIILNDILSYMIIVVDDLKVEKFSKTGDIQPDGMVIWDTLDLAVLQSCHFDGGFSPQNSTCRRWCFQNFNEELVSDSPS